MDGWFNEIQYRFRNSFRRFKYYLFHYKLEIFKLFLKFLVLSQFLKTVTEEM